jgi:uncharacterized protein YndB with AHSA1/START domain
MTPDIESISNSGSNANVSPDPSANAGGDTNTDTGPRRAIELDVTVDAPAAAVYAALTDPAQLASWFPPVASGSSAVGGKLLISWGPALEWTTTVVTAEPNRHIRWVDDPSSPLAVDWWIEARGGKTLVRLVHSGWSADAGWDEQYDATSAGWQYFLFNLRHYLERHRGTRRVLVSARRPTTLPRAEVWDRLLGAAGFALNARDRSDVREDGRVLLQLGNDPQRFDIAHSVEPTHLWGTLPGLSDALLFVEMEPGNPGYNCGIWLSTYGLNAERTAVLQQALSAMAERVIPAE